MATSAPNSSLYVGDLAPDVTEALLYEVFNAIGHVVSIRVCRDYSTRRSLGYAYVNFTNTNDADQALEALNFSLIRGKACRIMWSQRDPALRKSGAGNIFVRNLEKSIDNKMLYDTFSLFGNILSAKVAQNDQGESKGYGFVHFETKEAADSAIAKVNKMSINDQIVTVEPFKPREQRDASGARKFTNLFIKPLPLDITQEKLEELFAEFGKITSTMIAVDHETGKARGYGFVNFESSEAAEAAQTAMDGKELTEGTPLYVRRAMKKSERARQLRTAVDKARNDRERRYAGCNLYVKNLPDEVDDDKLKETFGTFGDIHRARVMVGPNGRSKGFGFVCFETKEAAAKAVSEMGNSTVFGKPLYVATAQRKDVRQAQLQAQRAKTAPQYQPAHFLTPMSYMPQMGQGPPGARGMPMYPAAGQQWRGPHPRMGGAQQQGVTPGGVYQQQPGQQGQQQQGGMRGGPQMMGGPGGNPAMLAHMQGQMGQQQGYDQQQGQQQQHTAALSGLAQQPPLDAATLAGMTVSDQKEALGERIYPLIEALHGDQAAKITGMFLEMDNGELLHMLDNPAAFQQKVTEAVDVLTQHEAAQQASSTAGQE